MPRISIVVPIYNVERYLDECLFSLSAQTFGDLEVVMVDDGSTDESPEIARGFAARDPRFRLVHQANAGLGAARNTGAAHAAGEFVAFVDSDDVVPRHAYELLLGALDRSGSDFASGNVRRLTPLGTQRAGFLGRAFDRTRLGTHITRFPSLVADRTAWNKLFRRSFWDRHGFRFPVGVYYEDTPVTLPAHYLAKAVDVIEDTVYLWRMREGPDLSITQRRTETKTLRDRVAAVDHVSRFLGEQGLFLSKAAYDRSVVGSDLRYFLEVLAGADDEYRRLFLDLANEFIDRADPWVLDQPLAIDRLKWQLVRRRALPELLEVLRFEEEELGDVPPVRAGRRWYGDYPYRNDERLAIPERTYEIADELSAVLRLNDLRWEGETLVLEGYAYVTLLGAPSADSQDVQLLARRRALWGGRLSLPTTPVQRPDVTAGAAQEAASLDWSGFSARLDASRLKRRGCWQEGAWEIGAEIRTGGLVRRSWRPRPAPLHALPLAELELADGRRLRAALGSSGRLTVEVVRVRSVVRSCRLEEGVLQLEGELGFPAGAAPKLHVSRQVGGATLEYPLYVDRSASPRAFLARLPISDLLGELDVGDAAAHAEEQGDGVAWDLAVATGRGALRPVGLDAAAAEPAWILGTREIALHRTADDGLVLTEGSFRPVISSLDWSPEGALAVGGSFRAPAGSYDLVLGSRSFETVRVPLEHDPATGRFAAEVAPALVSSPDGPRPLPEGVWTLGVCPRDAAADRAVAAVLDGELLRRLPLTAENGGKRFHVGVEDGEEAVLAVERDLEGDERGGFNQRVLRRSFYPARRAEPLLDAVVYSSFGGREYSDSPRAIHEELVRREAPFEHLWVVRDAAFRPPETARALRQGSREYYEALARARYVVVNDHWPRWFGRRPDQVSLQTWHGSPLKRLGLDLADRPKAHRAYRRALAQSADNWQYVVSPGAFATPILERAFPVGGDVLETGLPRTDLLLTPDRERLAEEAKRRLGLAGKRVVLYAPTYRDHLNYRPARRPGQLRDRTTFSTDVLRRDGYRFGPLLDFRLLRAALPADCALLFHRHRRIVDAFPGEPFMQDASGFPDPAALLLAADVLVTDYSSIAFDFAVTGRPIVFFTPDLEDYRDEIRGFSIDFEAEAPGPLLRTTEEVAEALRDPEATGRAHAQQYERFAARYCALSDGRASARVVDAVFRG